MWLEYWLRASIWGITLEMTSENQFAHGSIGQHGAMAGRRALLSVPQYKPRHNGKEDDKTFLTYDL
jgi:hypothetical protein